VKYVMHIKWYDDESTTMESFDACCDISAQAYAMGIDIDMYDDFDDPDLENDVQNRLDRNGDDSDLVSVFNVDEDRELNMFRFGG
jgi:hypothetical protein